MKITLPVKVNRKNSFIIVATIFTLLIYYFQGNGLFSKEFPVFLLCLYVVLCSFLTNLENMSLKNLVLSSVVPLSMVLGLVLSQFYFPNLGIILKVLVSLFYGFIFYIILLMNNIFLVVEKRGETIPLYRVAATWAQILLIIIAIPMFAGIYKLPYNFFIQTIVVFIISLIFSFYLLWILSFDEENKKARIGEAIGISLLNGFLVGLSNLVVSFIPTEAFLRAIFSANVLLFSTSLIYEHLKNNIERGFLIRSLLTVLFFLILIVAFQP